MGIVANCLTNRLTKPFVRLSFFSKVPKVYQKNLKNLFRAYIFAKFLNKNVHFYTYKTKAVTKAE